MQKSKSKVPQLVSIIIPAYNAEDFIKSAINSILNQNYEGDVEVIVIDDGSTDNTRKVVTEFLNIYPQIKLEKNLRKKGPSGARNTGLLKAKGDYIAFLDADDIWYPNHLSEGINFLNSNVDIDIVFFNFYISTFEKEEIIGNWFSERIFRKILQVDELPNDYYLIRDNLFLGLLEESFVHLQSVIIKRNVISSGILFNENISYSEDRDFFIKIHQLADAKFAFKDIITGIYYRHPNSLTHHSIQNSLSVTLDHISLFSDYLSFCSPEIAPKMKDILYKKHILCSYYYRQLKNYKASIQTILISFRYKICLSQFIEVNKISFFCILNTVQRLLLQHYSLLKKNTFPRNNNKKA